MKRLSKKNEISLLTFGKTLVLCAFISLTSCVGNNDEDVLSNTADLYEESILVDISTGNKLILQRESNDNDWEFQNKEKVKEYFNNRFPVLAKQVKKYDEFTIDINREDNSIMAIIATGLDSENKKISLAVNFKTSPNLRIENIPDSYVIYQSEETHTCTGAPCSSCGFERDQIGRIIGCLCFSGGGTCNHTVTSSGGKD
ncbi:hypothetical protein [Algoriphagus sp. Y33]|uniref:hypothetical protein n=1 Tax=Algoriphagus sp. Y33 TaxID=2772483 RepID=UPI00177ECF2D|nr:hypothetical protein [Algoriphagus sp. Y33]